MVGPCYRGRVPPVIVRVLLTASLVGFPFDVFLSTQGGRFGRLCGVVVKVRVSGSVAWLLCL